MFEDAGVACFKLWELFRLFSKLSYGYRIYGASLNHCAVYFGCLEITTSLLETSKWDVQATDFCDNTQLVWVAK